MLLFPECLSGGYAFQKRKRKNQVLLKINKNLKFRVLEAKKKRLRFSEGKIFKHLTELPSA